MKTDMPFPPIFRTLFKYLKRKLVSSFLLISILATHGFAQNTARIIIQPATTNTSVGATFTVAVRVDFTSSPSSTDAVEVHLAFEKTKLQVTSITKSAIGVLPNEAIPLQAIGSNGTAGTINDNGQINYAAFTLGTRPSADFDFLSVTFSVVGGGGTSSPLTLRRNLPSNNTDAQRSGSSILVSPFVINGTVNICTPPSATISASSGSSICNSQPVGLRLSAASGVSPYSLVVNGATYNNVTVGATTFATIPFPTYKIWPSTIPGLGTQNDGSPIETGTKFRSTQSGFVKGIRFYNGNVVSGTYKGKLWNFASGQLLASADFTSVTVNGWQELTFATPVSISANVIYFASMYSSAGNYVATDNYFNTGVTNGPITALDNTTSSNGMYYFGAQQTGPMTNFGNWSVFDKTNYWVDVIFTPNSNTFTLTSVTGANGCSLTGAALQILNVVSAECSSLPVSLLNFSASPQSNKVTLRWATSSEMNNRGFDIERSTDGANWTTIGFVAGAGNSSSTRNYTYLDQNLEPRKYFYRLKQIDIDDRFKYSAIVSATLNGKAEASLGQNYPNPFNNQTTIQFILPKAENVNLSLFDVSGRMVRVLVNASKEAGTHAINFNTGNLTKGVYYYKIQAGDFTDVKKLTIQ